jgi:hypothetical protein
VSKSYPIALFPFPQTAHNLLLIHIYQEFKRLLLPLKIPTDNDPKNKKKWNPRAVVNFGTE